MKKLSLAAALIFTLLITPDAESAQVYKCNVNGSVKYQQIPCTNDAVTTPPTGTSTPDPKKNSTPNAKISASSPQQGRPASSSDNWEKPRINTERTSTLRCDGRKHCSQMKSCDEAKYFLSNCPGVKMDGDGDGIPCEEQLCGH